MSRRSKTQHHVIELPSWIFDVDDEDEIEGNSSLLEELEIDPAHIYRYYHHTGTYDCVQKIFNYIFVLIGVYYGCYLVPVFN